MDLEVGCVHGLGCSVFVAFRITTIGSAFVIAGGRSLIEGVVGCLGSIVFRFACGRS
jgi:hypothetical protein